MTIGALTSTVVTNFGGRRGHSTRGGCGRGCRVSLHGFEDPKVAHYGGPIYVDSRYSTASRVRCSGVSPTISTCSVVGG